MPTQTPASRKFIPPPSTSSAARTQKHLGFSSQFARPSQQSSLPFNRTPFSSTAQKAKKDDIEPDQSEDEDDFDDEQVAGHQQRDEIRESREQLETHLSISQSDSLDDPTLVSQFYSTQRHPPEPDPDTHTHTIKRRKTTHPIPDRINDEPDSSNPPSSPTHSHNGDHTTNAHIQVRDSSPPAPTSTKYPQTLETDELSPPSPTHNSSLAHHPKTPTTIHSRYRDRLAAPSSSTQTTALQTHQPFPSFQSRLLASSSITSNSPNSTGPHLRNPHHHPSNLETTLPDAFSPSRKRGTREYIYGGYAETVRGWVVDLATRAVGNTPVKQVGRDSSGSGLSATADQRQQRQDGDTGLGTRKVLVEDVLLVDPSGRFVVVSAKATPDDGDVEWEGQEGSSAHAMGTRWILINTDPQSKSTSSSRVSMGSSKLAAVRSGATVLVKGGEHMVWDLDVCSLLEKDVQNESRDEGVMMTMCKVAVLWEVAP